MRSDRRNAITVWVLMASLGGFVCPLVADEGSTSLPWTEDGLKETFTVGTKIIYTRSGTDKKGREALGTHTFTVTEATDLVVSFEDAWVDPGTDETKSFRERSTGTPTKSWEDAFLLSSFPKSVIEVIGTEQVETPVGTFDTVVVEATNDFFKTHHTYYLIPDQPGVYAMFVDHGKPDEPANVVMTLQEVIRPGS